MRGRAGAGGAGAGAVGAPWVGCWGGRSGKSGGAGKALQVVVRCRQQLRNSGSACGQCRQQAQLPSLAGGARRVDVGEAVDICTLKPQWGQHSGATRAECVSFQVRLQRHVMDGAYTQNAWHGNRLRVRHACSATLFETGHCLANSSCKLEQCKGKGRQVAGPAVRNWPSGLSVRCHSSSSTPRISGTTSIFIAMNAVAVYQSSPQDGAWIWSNDT
jgi:hypothetical protein